MGICVWRAVNGERLRMDEERGPPSVCGGLYFRGGSRKDPPAQGRRRGSLSVCGGGGGGGG